MKVVRGGGRERETRECAATPMTGHMTRGRGGRAANGEADPG